MTSPGSFPADDFGIYYVLAECKDDYDSLPVSEAEEGRPRCQGVTGLRNLGNTCYMNAILQSLCSISPLVQYFLSGKYITALQNQKRGSSEVATAFAYLMTDMWLEDSDCVSPEIFRSALGNIYPIFMKKTQQDAQEFLIYVLNELHEALKKCHRRRSEKVPTQRRCRTAITNETSIVTRLFEGQLSYSIVCLKCENRSYKNEVFTVLSLPIASESECSLQDCLQCFFQQDTLTWNNHIHCSTCETKQETAVRASISKAPKIIIFHLKRFDVQGTKKRKLRTDIHYPLTNLDLTPYISPIFRKHPKYNLCAVVLHFRSRDSCKLCPLEATEVIPINRCMACAHEGLCRQRPQAPECHNLRGLTTADISPCWRPGGPGPGHQHTRRVNHFGDLDGGHYTAFCKNSATQAWYSFDDTRVSEIPDTSVQTATAYLLFYSCQPFSIPIQKH